MPKVSIIIPAYNVEQYIHECVLSVLHQTEKDIEVIVVDDGSTDKTSSILKQISHDDERLIVISQPNQGQPKARNKGLEVANGEYVQFVDSDDTLLETMTEKLLMTAEESEADIVVCSYKNINVYKNVTYIRRVDESVNNLKVADFCLSLDKEQLFNPLWNKLYKRASVKDILFENIVPGQDSLYNIMAFEKGLSYRYIDIPLYNYYSRGENSILSTYRPKLKESRHRLNLAWKSFFSIHTPLLHDKEAFLNTFLFETYYTLLKNLYRRKTPYGFKERTKFIATNILHQREFFELLRYYKPKAVDSRLFVKLVQTGNPFLTNVVFSILGKLKLIIRKKRI